MRCSASNRPGRERPAVTDQDLTIAFERFREDEVGRLAVATAATARLRDFEMRVEDAEDVLAASVLETVRAARSGKIVIKANETPARAAHRRMHMPVRNRVIDSFRERRPREESEILTDPAQLAGVAASARDFEFVEALDMLRRIPAADQALLVDSIALGTPDDELAEQEGITRAAIRQRRRRSLARLHAAAGVASTATLAEAA